MGLKKRVNEMSFSDAEAEAFLDYLYEMKGKKQNLAEALADAINEWIRNHPLKKRGDKKQ